MVRLLLGKDFWVPKDLKDVFRTAHEIPWQAHIRMQAAFQQYTDNAVSKTINMPNNATREHVAAAYLEAYNGGCKGITIFRDGCRGEQVLTTGTAHATVKTDAGATVVPRL